MAFKTPPEQRTMTKHLKRPSRRNFLLSVGAAGAAAVAAKQASPGKPVLSKGKRATQGYHASEHINNYYRTTKV
jgi:hypothetical protein